MKEIISAIIKENGPFPNNPKLPLLIYKKVLKKTDPQSIAELFISNGWKHSWINGIYSFHHFHSNTHEVIGVSSGTCEVQIGGEGGEIYKIQEGDLLILPAGVSHKNLKSSSDFVCVGSYPTDIAYDMCYGKEEERLAVDQRIKEVSLPKKDPVFGEKGELFKYWKISIH